MMNDFRAGTRWPPAADVQASGNRGIIPMLAGMASLTASDALLKSATASLASSQVIFLRSLCAIAVLLVLACVMRMRLAPKAIKNGWVILRAGLETLAVASFVIGITYLQLATVTAIYMAIPLLITVVAFFALGERVSARTCTALIAGFAGVLLVVQPASDQFTIWSLVIVASACFVAMRDIVTRFFVAREISSLTMTVITAAGVTVASAFWSIFQKWEPINVRQFGLIAGSSILWSCGYFWATVAMREGDLNLVSSLRYSALIFAAALGYLMWNDIPNSIAWCGMALIAVSGIYLSRSAFAATAKPS